jgi:hemolysin III
MSAFPYTPAERRADAVVHALGLLFAAIGGPALIAIAALRGEPAVVVAVAVYVATLMATVSLSAAYNLNRSERWREPLRRLDHGAIYLKIAGTYTPFAALSLPWAVGGWLLAAVWAVAGVGVALKLAAPRRFEVASIPLYLALGWAGVWVWADITDAISPPALTLLGAGGVLYTAGVAFHLWERLPFHNAIWHLHVLIATALMFAAVAAEVV